MNRIQNSLSSIPLRDASPVLSNYESAIDKVRTQLESSLVEVAHQKEIIKRSITESRAVTETSAATELGKDGAEELDDSIEKIQEIVNQVTVDLRDVDDEIQLEIKISQLKVINTTII